MNRFHYLVAIGFCLIANCLTAQEFRIIKDTSDYILKEVDSAFYYSHGLYTEYDFVRDTTNIQKVNGVLKLPLDNGKFIDFKDYSSPNSYPTTLVSYLGENKKLGYYLIEEVYYGEDEYYFLIDRTNGFIDTLRNIPVFSPTALYYGYCIWNLTSHGDVFVGFKKIKRNMLYKITFDDFIPDNFKWVNDYSFMFIDVGRIEYSPNKKTKYYLVEIKH